MTLIESTLELLKLIGLMIFVSSIGAQGWIAFLDISEYFTKSFEKFRPLPSQDKFTRIAIITGVFVLLFD